MQDMLLDFSITEYKMFINMVPDATMQLNFKKLPCIEFLCHSKEKCLQWSENTIKIFHRFSTAYQYKADLFSSTLVNNILLQIG